MRYLYIFEDGEIAQSDNPPNEEDVRMVKESYLGVIRIDEETLEELDLDGKWVNIPFVSPDD